MARKKVKMKTRPRAKPLSFGSDTEKKLPAVKQGSGGAGAKPVSTALDEPSARPLAKRGRSEVTRPGRPSIEVDGRQKRLPGFKDVPGPAERVNKPALPSPKPTATIGPKTGRNIGTVGAAATGAYRGRNAPEQGGFTKSIVEGATSGGLTGGLPGVAKGAIAGGVGYLGGRASNYKRDPRIKTWEDYEKKPAAKAPAAAPKPAAPKPTATVKPARTSTKPVPRASKPSRADVEREAFMKDLRESARKMKDTSSEMTGATGRMKEKMGEFAGSFKKGGSVKSRGDGIAQRGKTKGRFV